MRLTVAQALVRFLANQHSERDGVEQRLIAGCFGIFGHGNVAGFGQALLEAELVDPRGLPYVLARNEQGMVHAAAGYARMRNRLSTFACSTSIGPGATNRVTGAALATINRLPVLLLPADIFATRAASPVLQELEDPSSYDVSVNDCFRPVSRFWDRITRPEQLLSSALAAIRVLTDPVETGAVTLSLPQDVQAEAWDWPEEFFVRRVWRVRRPAPGADALAEAAALLRGSRRPLIVSGGGTIYAEATDALQKLVEATGIPVAETQAGKGSLPYRDPDTGALDGDLLPVDLAANAASMGAAVLNVRTIEEFESALRDGRGFSRTTVVHVETDPLVSAPSSEGWWDVPVAEVDELESTRAARANYERHKQEPADVPEHARERWRPNEHDDAEDHPASDRRLRDDGQLHADVPGLRPGDGRAAVVMVASRLAALASRHREIERARLAGHDQPRTDELAGRCGAREGIRS